MFVTGLLEDWMRKLEDGRRRRRRQHELRNNPRHYQTFISEQREIWTPNELFGKCCPHFLAGGELNAGGDLLNEENLRYTMYACQGGCRKAHPTITLFYDVDKSITVAILSHRLDPFVEYLQNRVDEGTATFKTPYYYELKGFIRENIHYARQQQNLFGRHLVKVAMGALRESDLMQSRLLEEHHCQQNHARRSFEELEKVLHICRMHRLSDDLDVLSIQCMQNTSQAFRRVATPMAQQRMKECELVVTPQVDGFFVSGYSVFRRSDATRLTSMEREQGRMVEYAIVSPSIVCRQPSKCLEIETLVGQYMPCNDGSLCKPVNENGNEECKSGEFTWGCEELSFATLEREWGDIGVTEYTGQKIVVHWRRGMADVVGAPLDSGRNTSKESYADLPIFDLRISSLAQKPKTMVFSTSGCSLEVDLRKMATTQLDDVTVFFEGTAKILKCRATFEFLVKSYARFLQPLLRLKYENILNTRPLLKHEIEFQYLVEVVATSQHQQ
jgi:hypothetical protein